MTSSISVKTKPDTSTIEMHRLQQQNRIHAQREKKQYAPYMNFKEDTTFNATSGSTLDIMINNEINRTSKKGWRLLPKSIRWDMIQSYFERDTVKETLSKKDIDIQKDKLRKALISDMHFDIDYNSKEKNIVRIPML